MMPRKPRLIALGLCLLAALNVAPVAAQEKDPQLLVLADRESAVGRVMSIEARLLDAGGSPVPDQVVTFFLDAEFLNTSGLVEIGRARTDKTGRAVLSYTLRQSGERTITARFDGNGLLGSAGASQALSVAQGPQTYVEKPPFRIPGANIVMVTAVIVATWGLLLVVIVLLGLISAEGSQPSEAARLPEPRPVRVAPGMQPAPQAPSGAAE